MSTEPSALSDAQHAQERLYDQLDDDLNDHETRLRKLEAGMPYNSEDRIRELERWRWFTGGGLALLILIYGAEKITAIVKVLTQ